MTDNHWKFLNTPHYVTNFSNFQYSSLNVLNLPLVHALRVFLIVSSSRSNHVILTAGCLTEGIVGGKNASVTLR